MKNCYKLSPAVFTIFQSWKAGSPSQPLKEQDLPNDAEALATSDADVGEISSVDDNGPAGVAAEALEADEEGWLLLGETVRETDPGPWVLVGDTETWELLGNTIVVKIPDTGEVAGVTVVVAAAEASEADAEGWLLLWGITDAGKVAGTTVVVAEDDISKDAKENEEQFYNKRQFYKFVIFTV